MAEEFLTSVPRFVLQMKNRTRSARLRKREKPAQTAYQRSSHGGHGGNSSDAHRAWEHFGHLGESKLEGVRLKGNLEEGEYRVWEGSEYVASGFRRCRCCGQAFYGDQGDVLAKSRAEKLGKEHLRTTGCSKILTEVYKLLLMDMKCVVCDKLAITTHWGIPLCAPDCVNRWKWYTPPILKTVGERVKRMGKV